MRAATLGLLMGLGGILAQPLQAENRFVLQSGANQGLIAGGVSGEYGFAYWALTVGLTPAAYHNDVITQGNGKLNFAIVEEGHYHLLIGGSLFVNASDDTFFTLPGKYPNRYYPPNAYFLGAQATILAKNGLFIEMSILDYYMEVLARNPRGSITNGEVISLGIGYIFDHT